VHVDISSLGPRSLELAHALFGPERLLFGSDCPIFSTRQSLEAVALAAIDDAARAALLHGNAERLLGNL
jgi:predicted TIM-barrel fold metal-dependent hydrolase